MARKVASAPKPEWERGFYDGVLSALACVFDAGAEVTAEEIVHSVDAVKLLRHAERVEDCKLPQVRATVRTVQARDKRGL